jgi:hypothetical protein
MLIRTLRSAVALAAAAAVFPAAAAVSSSASFSDFSFELIDLDPFDSVTPTLTWSSNFPTFSANALGTVSIGGGQSTTSVDGWYPSYSPTGISLSASGSYSVPTTQGSGSYAAQIGGSVFPFPAYSFTLTPNTAVSFTGLASLMASTTLGTSSADQVEEARASVLMLAWSETGELLDAEENLGIELLGGYYDPILQRYVYSAAPRSESYEVAMGVTFSNTTGEWMDGQLSLRLMADGFTSVSPVPEPSTYALMLAGLALVGGLAARKRGRVGFRQAVPA